MQDRNRSRIAAVTFAAAVALILAALTVTLAAQVGRWVAWLLLAAAFALPVVVAAVLGTAGHTVVSHANSYQRAIERAADRKAIAGRGER